LLVIAPVTNNQQDRVKSLATLLVAHHRGQAEIYLRDKAQATVLHDLRQRQQPMWVGAKLN
jgi:hypothetical protein